MTAMAAVAYRIRRLVRFQWVAVVALAVVVALAGGFVLVLVAGAERTATAPERYTDALDAPWDVIVEQQGGLARTDEVAALPSVARVEGVTFLFAGLVPQGSDDAVDAIAFVGSHEALGTQVTEGVSEDPDQPLGFTASRSFVDQAAPGSQVGSTFTLIGIPQEAAELRGFDAVDQAEIVGQATLVGVLDGATELQDGFAVAAFPTSVLDGVDIGTSGSQLVVELAPGATVDDLRADLDELGGESRFGIDPAEIVPQVVQDAASTRATGIRVLAAIVGVAVIVVLGQILTRQVRPGADLDLTLRALGMTRAQRLAEPVGVAAVPVLVGAALAGLAAFAVSGWFPLGFVEQIEPSPGIRFDPRALLLGPVLLALAILLWVAVSLALSRERVPVPAPQGALERLVGRIRRPSVATGVRFAFQRAPGEPGTARLSLAGLVIVLAGLVAGATFGASIGRLIDDHHRYGSHDLVIGQGGSELADGLVERVDADDGIAAFGIGGTLLASVGADSLDISAIQTVKGDVDPHLFEGRLPEADDEIALGKVSARQFGVGVGDPLTVAAPTGDDVDLTVTGIVLVPSIGGGDGMGRGGIVTLDEFHQLDPDASLSDGLGDFAHGVDRGAVMTSLMDDLGLEGDRGDDAEIGGEPPGDIINLDRIRSIPYVVAGAFGVLALLTLAHQLLVSGRRRRHDLAVLRAMGADGGWVTSAVHWQATAVAVAALAVAVPVGLVVGRLAFRSYADRLGALQGVTYGAAVIMATVLVIVVLANLVAAVTARGARRTTAARLLATE